MIDPNLPGDSPQPDPNKHPAVPLPAITLSPARAARLLEVAMTTPDGQEGQWQAMLWKPPTVEILRAWVPEYEVEQRVASGSSGWVYLARHRLLDRRVALKVLAPPEEGREKETADLRASEGRLIAQLSHPNVLRVYDSRPLPEGQHLFVFQYAEGGSLRQRLAEGPLPRAGALSLGASLAAGLAHAHAAGIIHRDLKPENILFHEAGTPMIGDFGSAVRPSPMAAAALACGTTGTPHYRAPEQVAGGPLGPAVDLYALGIILHEMLTGTLPEGTSTVRAPTLNAAIPSDLRALLSGLMHPDPARRGPEAAALVGRLHSLRPGMSRRRWMLAGGAAAAIGVTGWLAGTRRKNWLLKESNKVPLVVYPSVAAARKSVLATLQEFRDSETRGDWEAGNRYYGDPVKYFSGELLPHQKVVEKRRDFGLKNRNFSTLLLESHDFPPALAEEVAVRTLYWCTIEARDGTIHLGTLKDDVLFQQGAPGGPPWRIVNHQNTAESNFWECAPGRRLDEAEATALVDRFLTAENSGTIEEQLAWYAPWARYYSSGWAAQWLIRHKMEQRVATRPGFRCERRGRVTVQAGSHQRWRVEVPIFSFPVPETLPEADQVRMRSFVLAPLEKDKWFIIAEATIVAGQPGFDEFWKTGYVVAKAEALPAIVKPERTGDRIPGK